MNPSDPGTTGETILVVEDDEASREALDLLLRTEGYGVRTATNGLEALELIRRGGPFDLIVLDMLMPVLDGWAFLQRVRQAAPDLRVLVVTSSNLTREWARDHGCCGVVRKPLEFAPFLLEVRRCLAGEKGA